MYGRAESMPTARRGFLLPIVLGLLLVSAMFGLHAASGISSAAALSTHRVLHQRAFEAAERGLVALGQRLDAGEPPPDSPLVLASDALPTERATVEYRATAQLSLPPGYSSGRFVEQRGELRSAARLVRNSEVRLAEGVSRILPMESPP
jgi:Tfp pilus assembly protein PilX